MATVRGVGYRAARRRSGTVIGRGIAVRIALAALASAAVGLVILGGRRGRRRGRRLHRADGRGRRFGRSRAGDVRRVGHGRRRRRGRRWRRSRASCLAVRARADAGPAARRGRARPRDAIAEGDYAARVPREGPEELASLADSFNQMAASLERQEAMRRDFIANAAHELRTPLTNLQGYLEALRDGVITADRATYESLREEAERLVRLSRSLDALAEGDAGRRRRPRSSSSTSRWPSGRPSTWPSRRSSGPGSRSPLEVPDALPARANPDHLAQVLANLLSNAARYTPSRRHGHGPRRATAGATCSSRSPTPARASRPTTSSASSSASTGSRSRATGRAAAPASAWPSSSSSSRRPAAGSAPSRGDGQTRFWFSLPG